MVDEYSAYNFRVSRDDETVPHRVPDSNKTLNAFTEEYFASGGTVGTGIFKVDRSQCDAFNSIVGRFDNSQ
jgi:hypothetical protein